MLFCFFNSGGARLAPNLVPLDLTHVVGFFTDFQWNMLENSININNLCYTCCCCEKYLLKPLKFAFWGTKRRPTWPEKGQLGPRPKSDSVFF